MGTPADTIAVPALEDFLAASEAGTTVAEATAAAGTAAGGTAAASAATGAAAGAGALETLKTVSTILTPIASIAAASAGISAAKKAGQLTGAPQVAPPVTMPTFGSVDTMNTMRANIQEQMMRRGRASTILTSPSDDRLGG